MPQVNRAAYGEAEPSEPNSLSKRRHNGMKSHRFFLQLWLICRLTIKKTEYRANLNQKNLVSIDNRHLALSLTGETGSDVCTIFINYLKDYSRRFEIT
jgi:hypothetical protein